MESIIRSSKEFIEMDSEHENVEIWDDNYIEDGWSYWNIVSNNSGIVRKLVYLKIKDKQIKKRTYDEQGDDLWLPVI